MIQTGLDTFGMDVCREQRRKEIGAVSGGGYWGRCRCEARQRQIVYQVPTEFKFIFSLIEADIGSRA